MRVTRFADARAFLQRAQPWLLRREAEHNLILGLAGQLESGKHPYQEPFYLATVESHGEVCGCAFRTPPLKLGLTRLPGFALALLVEDVHEVYRSVPAVIGPESVAVPFAALWIRTFGGRSTVGMRQRIHCLERVIPPRKETTGAMRLAASDDYHQMCEWIDAFQRDSQITGAEPEVQAARLIEDQALYLWVDGESRSMAAAMGETPNGTRIGCVYTPPALRGRGYASALVAELSQRLLDAGRRYCFLYTDLANPTPNVMYHRIGYRPVCDVVDVNFLSTVDEDGDGGE